MSLGHMSNEGDERQVNSISPSNIDIQNSRRVTLSVDPGNEVTQRSTSMTLPNAPPSDGTDVELWVTSFPGSTDKVTLLEF